MRLVVGLGNPGRQYVGTRHNVGFEVIDAAAKKLGWLAPAEAFDNAARGAFEGLTLSGVGPGGEKVLLLKPQTYMNLSGRAVQSAAGFYQLSPADVLIVLDDLALPCGKLRLRAGGSDGGHNGLRDIERALGTSQYPRLRLGIDPPPPPVAGKDYVLGRFAAEQRKAMDPAVARAAEAVLCWIERGIEAAMNRYNAADAPDA